MTECSGSLEALTRSCPHPPTLCRGGTRMATDPSPPHLPSVGGAPTCLPGRTASSRVIKHCLHEVMGRELIHHYYYYF